MQNKEKGYFLYARKSTEDKFRQVQSIDDQVREMTALAERKGIQVIKTFTETKSAKAPYSRPVFSQMMKELEKGNVHGVLAWKMDRLSRNPVDSGQVQWLLQRRKIHSILVAGREYRSEDNIIALCVESGADTQYIVDLRRNVIRGMKSKVEKGWLPSVAPLGYLNYRDIEEVATIIKDPERFQMVRGIWDLALAGTQTQKILDIANNQWGLRTRKTRKKWASSSASLGCTKSFPTYSTPAGSNTKALFMKGAMKQ